MHPTRPTRPLLLAAVLPAVAVALVATSASAQSTYVFEGNDSFVYTNPNTWLVNGDTPATAPTLSDDVVIDSTSVGNTFNTLLLSSSQANEGNDLTVTGRTITLDGGNSSLLLDGNFSVNGSASLTTRDLSADVFSGVFDVTDATMRMLDSEIFTNSLFVGSGALLDIGLTTGFGSSVLPTGATVGSGAIVNVNTGTLAVNRDQGSFLGISGTLNVGANGAVVAENTRVNPTGTANIFGTFTAGRSAAFDGITLINGGSVLADDVNGGNVEIGGSVNVINAGQFSSVSPVVVSGQLTTDSTSSFSAFTLNVLDGGSATLTGPYAVEQDLIIDAGGTAALGGGGNLSNALLDNSGTVSFGNGFDVPTLLTRAGSRTEIGLDSNIPATVTTDFLGASGTFAFDLFDASLSDQIATTADDAFFIDGATLELDVSNLTDGTGSIFTLLDNGGTSAIDGTFANVGEGETFTVGQYQFVATYMGGDGNDFQIQVLSVIPEPASVGLLGVAAGGLLLRRRRD